MKTLAIVTATRAEYGLLSSVIKKFKQKKDVDVKVVVTGTHLSKEYGLTVQEIESDGVNPDAKIEILSEKGSENGVSETMSNAIVKFTEYFADNKCDAVMLLGDRYETLAIAIAAINNKVPVIHLYGGEATLGALDELYRNAITKLSFLHFTSTQEYRNRVVQMGESPDRVFNVGSLGVENIKNIKLINKKDLEEDLGISLDNYAVMTFHPCTADQGDVKRQTDGIIKSMISHPEINFICTKANSDLGGCVINELLKQVSLKFNNIFLFDSLGMKRYLSAVKYSKFVIGNSSSGIIEVPSLGVPTINIGDRQKGRVQAESIINCSEEYSDIMESITKATDNDFLNRIGENDNPYEKDDVVNLVVKITYDYLVKNKMSIVKGFYDI